MRSVLRLWSAGPLALLVLAACGTVTRSAHREANADLAVTDFCSRFGRQSASAVADLFVDSARFDIDGIGVSFVGRKEIARLADYGSAVHSRLSATGLQVSRETVSCRLEEKNHWLGLLAVEHASYNGWFVVSGPRIASARLRLAPESNEELGIKLAGFLAWLSAEDPETLQRLLPGGRPVYDSRAVPELLSRLRQWRLRVR